MGVASDVTKRQSHSKLPDPFAFYCLSDPSSVMFPEPWVLEYFVDVGIGLHNLGF